MNSLSPTPTVRTVVEAMRLGVLDGTFRRGTHLPSEMELAAMFQVSRGSIRGAIEVLVASGELERRPHGRPLVVGNNLQGPATLGTDVYVWVAQTMSDDSSLPFLQGVSRGLVGTPYRMVVREPSLFVENVVVADERQFLRDLLKKPNAAGAIIWRDVFADDTGEVGNLLERSMPLVFVDSPAPGGLPTDHVGTSNVTAARRCVEYLLELGHRRIVCVTDSDVPPPLTDRVKGYWRAMRHAGLEHLGKCIIPSRSVPAENGDERLGGVYARYLSKSAFYADLANRIVREILRLDPQPTALFVGYDILAHWVCAALEGHDIRVPEQMSVVGFDWRARWDKALGDVLTTASQDFEGFGRHAADLLLDRISGDAPAAPRHVLLDAPLIVRTTTSPLQVNWEPGFSSMRSE